MVFESISIINCVSDFFFITKVLVHLVESQNGTPSSGITHFIVLVLPDQFVISTDVYLFFNANSFGPNAELLLQKVSKYYYKLMCMILLS